MIISPFKPHLFAVEVLYTIAGLDMRLGLYIHVYSQEPVGLALPEPPAVSGEEEGGGGADEQRL